ncbi:4-methylaminobutanoate oxidase (formaldehyde-forming) [Arthrobacter sp. Hiyo4]|nr:4-methylaminobutanoate oxidase (formaldehyde-forming) [Arthrobacter sp. Hiyo4]
MDRLVDRSISAKAFTDDSNGSLPQRVRTVVVGGGIIGSSIAYHLALAGESDVLLLENNVLGSGTTWHAAGLVTGARSSAALTKLAKYSLELYRELEELSGVDISFRPSGSLNIARTPGRLDEIRYARDVAEQQGVRAEMLTDERFKEVWPIASTEGSLAPCSCRTMATLTPDMPRSHSPRWHTLAAFRSAKA